ncbi:hypothetical protein VKS41_004066 [Umbelopsis sp. WA50703]
MEGIKKRKNPSTPLEDQAEFLDEQEQERLVSDLRKENEKSNRSIQVCGTVYTTIIQLIDTNSFQFM